MSILNSIPQHIYSLLNGGPQPYNFWGGGWVLAGFAKPVKGHDGGTYPIINAEECENPVLVPTPNKKGMVFFTLENLRPTIDKTTSYDADIKMYVWYDSCKLNDSESLFMAFLDDFFKKVHMNVNRDLGSLKNVHYKDPKTTICDANIFKAFAYKDTTILNTPPYECFCIDFKACFSYCDGLPEFTEPNECQCLF